MMLKSLFFSILVLILSSSNIFAQDQALDEDEGRRAARERIINELDEWNEIIAAEKTAGKGLNRSTARERIINELDEWDKIIAHEAAIDERLDRAVARREMLKRGETAKAPRLKERKPFFYDPVGKRFTRFPDTKYGKGLIKYFSIKNTRNALGFRFELEDEERKTASSATPTDRSRLLFEEFLEMDFKGSVYHPNLVSFDVNLENGLKQAREKFHPNLTGKWENSYLNQFHVTSSFLSEKPYAFSLFADKSKEIENREFFERQIINSTRYAGNFGYKNEFIPVGFSFSNSSRTIDRASRPSQNFDDDELSLKLSNESKKMGETRFEATRNKFSRTEAGTSDQTGTSWDLELSNQKYLSDDDKKSLYSFLNYYDLTGTTESSIFSLTEDLNIEHSGSLTSSYAYNFSNRSSSGVKTRDNRVSASLRHKLYESLTSSFTSYYFNSEATASSQDKYGLSIDEDYTKKLGKIGRLSLGAGLSYSDEKRKSPDGVTSIIDESVTLTDGTVTLLDRPRVDTSTVVVTNLTGATTYILNTDYQLISVGQNTQVQRIASGSISNGQEVLVDYEAKSNPSLKFNTLGENYRFRIDFLDELIGVYYRLVKETHPSTESEEDVILQTLTDTVVGLDFNYKNLTIEVEDEDYDSNLSPYKRLQIRESLSFNPALNSTLTFQSSQIRVRLVDTQDTQKFLDFLSRYSIGLGMYSRFNVEAGYRWQEGTGIDLDELYASSSYELNLGKFEVDIRYDFKRQLYVGDRLVNHFFYIETIRIF